MAACLTGSPQRTGNPKRHDGQLRIEMAANGTLVRTQRNATARGMCRLRVDRNDATHRQAVIVRSEKENVEKRQREKWRKPDLSVKGRFALCEWLSYKRRRRSQKRKYKRETGKAETGESCSSLPVCLFAVIIKIQPS